MSEEKEVLLGFLIGSISILRDMNIQFTEKSRNKLADKIMEILTAYEEKEKIIDEMAGYLAIIRDCPNENCGANLDCENRCNNDDDLIEECWKMYFERKIKYE